MKTDLDWFEFRDILGKHVNDRVWVPLWLYQTVKSDIESPEIGHWEDIVFSRAVAAFDGHKHELMAEECYQFNPYHENRSSRFSGDYFRADTYYVNNIPVGEFLVLYQDFGRKAAPKVIVNQDLVFALGLVSEGDDWVRPDEGYDVVLRQERDAEGKVCKVEIKQKYLRDYLCARGMGLVVATYNERVSIMEEIPQFDWPDRSGVEKQISKHTRWEGYYQAMDDHGDVSRGKLSVFTSGYKSIKTDDVPRFNPLSDDGEMYSESFQTKENPITRYRVVGELRRTEWIDPGSTSVRVGGNKESSLDFYAEADGRLKSGEELSFPPQWLWFQNDVINRILHYRGSVLSWYSAQTGSIAINADDHIHFGINRLGFVNVFAKDIVTLPRWQQEVWKGFNVAPDGGVSAELQMSQMQCKPANTVSAEDMFFKVLNAFRGGFEWATNGIKLYKDAHPFDAMRKLIHRFVVQRDEDVYLLAKNIMKYTAESFNLSPVWPIVRKTKDEKQCGSLKILERFLAQFTSEESAHDIMSPWFYLYDLRVVDAHPKPQDETAESKLNLGIKPDMIPIAMGEAIIRRITETLYKMLRVLQEEYQKRNP